MLIATDIHYRPDNQAKAAAVTFDTWAAPHPTGTYTCLLDNIAPYEPGAFYKRELPCLLEVLKQIDLHNVEAILVDGYVILDDAGKIGLGGHLFEALGGQIPVVGVAKSNFANNLRHVVPVLRGESARPLYVTAMGLDLETAAACVRGMSGVFRLPDLLKLVDSVGRMV